MMFTAGAAGRCHAGTHHGSGQAVGKAPSKTKPTRSRRSSRWPASAWSAMARTWRWALVGLKDWKERKAADRKAGRRRPGHGCVCRHQGCHGVCLCSACRIELASPPVLTCNLQDRRRSGPRRPDAGPQLKPRHGSAEPWTRWPCAPTARKTCRNTSSTSILPVPVHYLVDRGHQRRPEHRLGWQLCQRLHRQGRVKKVYIRGEASTRMLPERPEQMVRAQQHG